MPRPRKPRIPHDLIEKLERLEREAAEDRVKTAEAIARAEQVQRRLREIILESR